MAATSARPGTLPGFSKTSDVVPAKKVQKYEVVSRDQAPELYRLMDRLVARNHSALAEAKIALGWVFDCKEDKDGRLMLGKARLASEVDRQLHGYEFIVLLNFTAWNELGPTHREALLDDELCRCACDLSDETGEASYRLRKPDVEVFIENTRRYGSWRKGVEDLVKAALGKKEPDLFAGIDPVRDSIDRLQATIKPGESLTFSTPGLAPVTLRNAEDERARESRLCESAAILRDAPASVVGPAVLRELNGLVERAEAGDPSALEIVVSSCGTVKQARKALATMQKAGDAKSVPSGPVSPGPEWIRAREIMVAFPGWGMLGCDTVGGKKTWTATHDKTGEKVTAPDVEALGRAIDEAEGAITHAKPARSVLKVVKGTETSESGETRDVYYAVGADPKPLPPPPLAVETHHLLKDNGFLWKGAPEGKMAGAEDQVRKALDAWIAAEASAPSASTGVSRAARLFDNAEKLRCYGWVRETADDEADVEPVRATKKTSKSRKAK